MLPSEINGPVESPLRTWAVNDFKLFLYKTANSDVLVRHAVTRRNMLWKGAGYSSELGVCGGQNQSRLSTVRDLRVSSSCGKGKRIRIPHAASGTTRSLQTALCLTCFVQTVWTTCVPETTQKVAVSSIQSDENKYAWNQRGSAL